MKSFIAIATLVQNWMDWVKEFSKLSTYKKRSTCSWLPKVQLFNLYLLLLSRKTASSLSSAHFLGVVTISGLTSIEKRFSVDSFTILEIKVLIEFYCLYFCLFLRSLNRTTLRSVYCKKAIIKLRNYNWGLRRECVNQWRNSGHTCKGNSAVYLIVIATTRYKVQ